MGRQFRSECEIHGEECKLKSYSGEPLEKFKERMIKDGHKVKDSTVTNADIQITDEGLNLVGKLMELAKQIMPHIKEIKRGAQFISSKGLIEARMSEKENTQIVEEKLKEEGDKEDEPPKDDDTGAN